MFRVQPPQVFKKTSRPNSNDISYEMVRDEADVSLETDEADVSLETDVTNISFEIMITELRLDLIP